MKTVTLLGSTGSIGVNTLDVVRRNPSEFRVVGLAAGSNLEILQKQIQEFNPKAVFLKDRTLAADLLRQSGRKLKIFSEADGLKSFSDFLSADILVAATSGTSALSSVLSAISSGKRVALANKEILVMAGSLVMQALKENPSSSLIPVDSEHNAIFQCLEGQRRQDLHKIILTSSGGPLRTIPKNRFSKLSKETVINHPKWKMGKKISVDSATLMNKGLEMIEAAWLFNVSIDTIQVLVHPEAVIHSMVEFCDGSVIAQAGVTDMRLPIQYAMTYPGRLAVSKQLHLDFARIPSLTFEAPDQKKFPCLGLARAAALQAGSAPCVLSAADEVAVKHFLEDRINFIKIPSVIEKVLSRHKVVQNPKLSQIESAQAWAIEETEKLCLAR